MIRGDTYRVAKLICGMLNLGDVFLKLTLHKTFEMM